MLTRLSGYFKLAPRILESFGVFDAYLGIDNKLFVDPNLSKGELGIGEFEDARGEITRYFSQVLKLLKASKTVNDVAWDEAKRRLNFKEEKGAH
jgi:hypothetical protein